MIGISVLDTSVIDMLRGLRADGEPDPLIELTEAFVIESATLMNQMNSALAAGDDRAMRRAAHSLKGMSATVGALQLSQMSREMELADAGTIDRDRIDELEREIDRAAQALTFAVGLPY